MGFDYRISRLLVKLSNVSSKPVRKEKKGFSSEPDSEITEMMVVYYTLSYFK